MDIGSLHVLLIMATRPNIVKAAALYHEMLQHKDIRMTLLHTGQHYDPNMSQNIMRDLELPVPNYHLGVNGPDAIRQEKEIDIKLEKILQRESPDIVVVFGDVNATLFCARTTKKNHFTLAHVEAGLRSFDPDMPEEYNRRETDHLSDLLFVSEQSGMANLEKEGLMGPHTHLVGNVMIDTLLRNLNRVETTTEDHGEYILWTMHRPSNVDCGDRWKKICDQLSGIVRNHKVIFPIHPRTKRMLRDLSLLEEWRHLEKMGLRTLEPQPYLRFLSLIGNARMVITDSGGVQEEAFFLRKSCITIRANTERPVTLSGGANVLFDFAKDENLSILIEARWNKEMQWNVPQEWDGSAARRIVSILKQHCGNRNHILKEIKFST